MLLGLNSSPFVFISKPSIGLASEGFKERTRYLLCSVISCGRVGYVFGRGRRCDTKKGINHFLEVR